MILVNMRNGVTLKFDLKRGDDLKQWQEWSSVRNFREKISGIGILKHERFHALQIPKKFNSVQFFADLVFKQRNDEVLVACHEGGQ